MKNRIVGTEITKQFISAIKVNTIVRATKAGGNG